MENTHQSKVGIAILIQETNLAEVGHDIMIKVSIQKKA
jgi:hypothetical protein